MNTNLDKIALDLYGKIQTRFPDIKIGDENAEVLSKKSDIPRARFFEFEYKEHGNTIGTVTVDLDEDDGIVVQVSGDLADSRHRGAFKFIRSFRQFAKDRLLKFDVQNIGKDNLDKRDYQYKAKPKEFQMEPMMESKLFGTARISYQDLGEAKIIIKHSQPINTDLAAGRTMHIESIYVENAEGERFKYPFKHLNGARALAEHLKHGGIPYDNIGKHIVSLSEELAQLRKFKGYVGRNEALSEAMGDITNKVMERIEQVKKEVQGLQRPAYYESFAESFAEKEEQIIPEDIMNDWIDRLTIRTFNEELKTAFPYIFKLVDESQIPIKELAPDDLLAEEQVDERATPDWIGKVAKAKELLAQGMSVEQVAKQLGVQGPNNGLAGPMGGDWGAINYAQREMQQSKPAYEALEDNFENFLDSIVNEDDADGENTLFSPNKQIQQQAIDKLNNLLGAELKGGADGINAKSSLAGIIDDAGFLDSLSDVDGDLDVRPLIQQFVQQEDPQVALQLKFDGSEEIGGQEMEQPPEAAAPLAPAPEAPAAPAAPAAPQAPVAEGRDEDPPFDADPPRKNPIAKAGKHGQGHSTARHLARHGLMKAIQNAKKAGAQLDTTLDFGHKTMTLHDAIKECGMTAMECGFDTDGSSGNPVHDMLKTIAGFWNSADKNFTIGGTRAKTKVVKAFKDGEFPEASEQDLTRVLQLIDKMDPSGNEHNQIMRLAGIGGSTQAIDEDPTGDKFSKLMQQFQQGNPGVDVNQMFKQYQQANPGAKVTQSNTSTGMINGKPASYDDAMSKAKGMNIKLPSFGDDGDDMDMDFTNPQGMMQKMQGKIGGMVDKMPNQQVQAPGIQMNPRDMMKDIMGKINFGK